MTHEQLVEKVARLLCKRDGIDPDARSFGDAEAEVYRGIRLSFRPEWMDHAGDARAILSLIADAIGEPTDAMKTAAGLVCGSRDIGHEAIARAIDASPLKAGGSPR